MELCPEAGGAVPLPPHTADRHRDDPTGRRRKKRKVKLEGDMALAALAGTFPTAAVTLAKTCQDS